MKEEEIRKPDAFKKYLELAKMDAQDFSRKEASFVSINCPACNGSQSTFEFEKHKFRYVLCSQCLTLFANPRPSFTELNNFYTDSPSAHFWTKEFFPPVAESRRKMIFQPRAEYISNKLTGMMDKAIGDIGAGFGIFLEELRKTWPKARFVAIEPSAEQADICRNKGLEVKNCALEDLSGFEDCFDLLTAFELLEHLFDPRKFLACARSILKPGGYFLITTLNVMGFDIQLLWEHSKSINPPHHLNFFNLRSLSLLLKECGFEIIEVSTPGRLDWEIVEGMIKNERLKLGRFWDWLASKGIQECKEELQDWITKNNLSSHMRILCRKDEKRC